MQHLLNWIPAFAGMTSNLFSYFNGKAMNWIPAFAGMTSNLFSYFNGKAMNWIPAFAGMTSNLFSYFNGKAMKWIPAFAGMTSNLFSYFNGKAMNWIPAFAGMTSDRWLIHTEQYREIHFCLTTSPAVSSMAVKCSSFSDFPPMSAPSMSGCSINSLMLSGLTLPP